MLLADRCRNNFSSQSVSRGSDYAYSDCVTLVTFNDCCAWFEVDGSQGDYDVVLDWSDVDDAILAAACTCPYFDDGHACKHLWASLLTLDHEGIGDSIRGTSKLKLVQCDFSDLAEWDADAFETAELLAHQPASIQRIRQRHHDGNGSATRGPRTPSWQQQLAVLNHHERSEAAGRGSSSREVRYVMNANACEINGKLELAFYQREMKKNGEFGKLNPFSLHQSAIERAQNATDRHWLQFLYDCDASPLSGGYYSYYRSGSDAKSTVTVPKTTFDFLLPELAKTERFVAVLDSMESVNEASVIKWDAGEPWRFTVRIDANDQDQTWSLTGWLKRPGEEDAISLDRPVMVVPEGLVLFGNQLARLDADGNAAWIELLRRTGQVDVPYDDRHTLLEHLWKLAELPEIDWPANLRTEEVNVQPRGRLEIHSAASSQWNRRLDAKLSFEYDGQIVSSADTTTGIFDPETDRIYRRDPKAEEELLTRLRQVGVQPENSYYRSSGDEFTLSQRKLPQIVEELVRDGWSIQAEGHRIRRPGECRLSVRSDRDWFDLEGEFDFDGAQAKLPELLAAVRRGDRYVQLDDGSRGLLPEQWLAQNAALAGLGELKGDAVRFQPSQALLLDALLAAQDNPAEIDRRFANFRKKLHSFQGVAPRTEPRWFEGQLREYQQVGLGWMHFLKDFGFGGCLADDMGLGKTVQVLALLEARRVRRLPAGETRKPSLAIVPKSLVFNWIDEAKHFAPRLNIVEYTGRDRKALLDDVDNWDVLITTYGTLRRDVTELKDIAFDYVILDEAQAIKNAKSQGAKACRLLHADHRLALTGTPIENHLGELWSLFEFLNPGMLGRSSAFNTLSKRSADDNQSLQVLSRAIAPYMLRRTKQQVLTELPEKNEQTLSCDLSRKQRKQYDELRDHYRSLLTKKVEQQGLQKSKIHVLEALMRLRQAACHPGLIDKSQNTGPSAKFDVLLEQLADVISGGHKALVFSQFTSLLALLRERLDAIGNTYEYLDGRTRKRQAKVQRFQEDPECSLFLISLKAGGHGLNLTAADYVYILDPWWNPAVEAQAVDRTHRIGQTRPVFAYRLIARDTIEEKILELQKSKKELADSVISANDSLIRQLTADDLQLLLS